MKERKIRKYISFFNAKNAKIIKYYFETLFEDKNTVENWSDVDEKSQNEKSLIRIKKQFPGDTKSDSLKIALESIIKTCRKNKIELEGIKFPLTKTYNELLRDRNYGADSIFRSNNLPIKNFKKWNFSDDKLYKNQDHLNEKGAAKFVKDLF